MNIFSVYQTRLGVMSSTNIVQKLFAISLNTVNRWEWKIFYAKPILGY